MATSVDTDCIFCKIVAEEVPADKVYESETILAFLDVNPSSKGHTLVIPKQHFATLVDVPEPLLKDWLHTIQLVTCAVKKVTQALGANVIINVDKGGGQVVFHAHFHVVPRFADDGLKLFPPGSWESDEETKAYQQKISQAIKELL